MSSLNFKVFSTPFNRGGHPWIFAWLILMAGVVLLGLAGKESLPWAFNLPRPWHIPIRYWISDFMKWLLNDFDLGLFTFREFTRSLAWIIEQPYWLAKSLLSTGFLEGQGSDAVEIFPRLSWLALIALIVLFSHYVSGWKLALLTGSCFAYLTVFGQWESAMVTLSSIVIAVPFGVLGGLLLGIAGHRSPRFEMALRPLLDLMQTVPVFAYLVPVLILFGFGPVAAMIATIIYAMPPMVRVTMLALAHVPKEVVEFGTMAGCSTNQLLWKVQIPSVKSTLMVGVNQVVMLSLNMVIIASMIGAGGLGFDVLNALKRLKIGEGIEAGLAITLLAIALDRLSQSAAQRPPPMHGSPKQGIFSRHPYIFAAFACVALTWIGSTFIGALNIYPESLRITTGAFGGIW